ncbi:hypothetical protein GQ53DRAFT_830333 [Thozetella sp. PMI_491]|nr:hypothetical protein GQ53DRAFT_830333 [Thozetella sp. PMI_491]
MQLNPRLGSIKKQVPNGPVFQPSWCDGSVITTGITEQRARRVVVAEMRQRRKLQSLLKSNLGCPRGMGNRPSSEAAEKPQQQRQRQRGTEKRGAFRPRQSKKESHCFSSPLSVFTPSGHWG